MLDHITDPLQRMGTLTAHSWQGRLYAAADTPSAALDAAARAVRAGLVPLTPAPAVGFALLYASRDLAVFWWEAAMLHRASCRLQSKHAQHHWTISLTAMPRRLPQPVTPHRCPAARCGGTQGSPA